MMVPTRAGNFMYPNHLQPGQPTPSTREKVLPELEAASRMPLLNNRETSITEFILHKLGEFGFSFFDVCFQVTHWLSSPKHRTGAHPEKLIRIKLLAEKYPQQKSQAELAGYIKKRCLEAAREGYEHARMSGLCEEGAAEAALSAVQSLSTETLLREFDEASWKPENRDPGQ